MKRVFWLRYLPIALCCLLTSCLLFSTYPLSDENNCHETMLDGKWVTSSKESSGAVKTETVVIRDAGKTYSIRMESVEVLQNAAGSSRKTEERNTSFILTKLEKFYFVSVLTTEGTYNIFKIEVNPNELRVFGLNQEGVHLAEKQLLFQTPDGKTKIKVPQSRLQKWCVHNAALFAAQIYCYQKSSAK